jgi:hypothetical protein
MIHDGKSQKLPFDAAEALAHLKANDAKLGALIDRDGAQGAVVNAAGASPHF